jgi:hypothetical protein
MKKNSEWILQTIKKEFKGKFDVNLVFTSIQEDSQIIDILLSEIQEAIKIYNKYKNHTQMLGFGRELFINATHFASVYNEQIPNYETVLLNLQSDKGLYNKVINELTTSAYFKEVYEIKDSIYLLQNLLILYYRTTLLFSIPLLREKGVQISSTIEEMACILEMNGTHTTLFLATKHWIENWEEEEFAQALYERLLEEKLI